MIDLAFYVLKMCDSFVIIKTIKFLFVFHHNKHSIIMRSFVKWKIAFKCWRFFHCEQFSFKAHISITTCLNFLIFAIYVGNTFFKYYISFILIFFYNCVTLFGMTKCHLYKVLNGGGSALLWLLKMMFSLYCLSKVYKIWTFSRK